jgi:Glyoxalase/Bleomycin resistance protein/Dioxygenase superfamily
VKWSRRAGVLRLYDHIDLRVRNLAEARTFMKCCCPRSASRGKQVSQTGFNTKLRHRMADQPTFFGVTESPGHVANESRIAFWAQNPAKVDRLAGIAARAGAQNVEGPGWEDETYYAVFFEDPSGNRLEICHRTGPVKINN